MTGRPVLAGAAAEAAGFTPAAGFSPSLRPPHLDVTDCLRRATPTHLRRARRQRVPRRAYTVTSPHPTQTHPVRQRLEPPFRHHHT